MASGEICSKMSEQVTSSQPNYGESLQQQQLQSNQDTLPYKNRLQEFTQRAKIQFPIYQTINEGQMHAPKFRSTVLVDGNTYISSNTFSSRRAAELDVAKVALEGISKKINNWISNKMSDEGFPPIYEEKAICKSILHEFAAKMNLESPKYETTRFEGVLPGFVSSVVFGGLKYTGEACKSKKEAEQNAAREAMVSILGNLGLGTILPEIIKSKAKWFSSEYKRSCSDVTVGVSPVGIDSGNGTGASATKEGAARDGDENKADTLIQNAAPEATGDRDANKAGNLTENAAPIALDEQISDLQPLQVQPNLDILNCNQKRKSKNKKKKANKKLKTEVVSVLNNVHAVSDGAT